MQRRDVLKMLAAAACSPLVSSALAGEAGKPGKPRWKTAIGLNGFQSASAKYGKTLPIKEVLDFSHFDMMSGAKGQISDMVKRIGVKNIGYVHLTDCDGTLRDGGTSKHLPCGAGHIDIAGALATLRAGGFAGWIMIDAWETPDPYEANRQGKLAIDRARA